jgi:hypothetical protein
MIRNLTSGDFNCETADLLRAALNRFIVCCLDREWYDSINEVIRAVMRDIRVEKFTWNNFYVIFDLGFNLYYIGEEGSATPRMSQRSPQSLKDSQELFVSFLVPVRRSVINSKDAPSVTQFCLLLERLAEAGIGRVWLSSHVWEILESAYGDNLLEHDALETLTNLIGACRYGWDDEDEDEEFRKMTQGDLDREAAHIALYIVALGLEKDLDRMMGNARFYPSKRMPDRLAMKNGLDESIYATVAKEFGFKSWPNRWAHRTRRPRKIR